MHRQIKIRTWAAKERRLDLRDLQVLRKAKADPRNRKGRPIEEVAAELGVKLK